jgi:hypothetical protein
LHIIHNLKKKLIAKKQRQILLTTKTQHTKKWVTFSYHSPLTRKINNIFKHSNLNIALRATNTIHRQLTDKIVKTNKKSSGIYKLKCNICNNAYVGQWDRTITTRHKVNTRYIRTNNLIPAYALHILNNRHEYGTADETLELLKPCNKGIRMNFWEALYMQAFHQHNILIEEQHVNYINPLYELAYMSRGQLRIPQLRLILNSAIYTHPLPKKRLSPTNFDSIRFVFKILLLWF